MSQQSTISSIVDACCVDENSFQDMVEQLIMFVKQTQGKEVRVIIDEIKRIIKSKKNDSPSKVLALKLLNTCLMEGKNDELFVYAEKKIMRRLQILARFKKEQIELDKGALLFGKSYNQRASADFLKLLLLYIKIWANKFQVYTDTNKQTEMNKIFQSLIKDKVNFPSEESILSSLCGDYEQEERGKGGPNSTSNSSSANQSFKKDQFQSHHHMGVPDQLDRPQSQGIHRDRFMTQKVGAGVGAVNQSMIVSARESLQPQVVDANAIKANYKKLSEFENNAKAADEMLGESNGQMDAELMKSLRDSLQEGVEFSQNFLNTLMEGTFIIKDKEQKVNKVIRINTDISTILEKYLVYVPYSPGELEQVRRGWELQATKHDPGRSDEMSVRQSQHFIGGGVMGGELQGEMMGRSYTVSQTPSQSQMQRKSKRVNHEQQERQKQQLEERDRMDQESVYNNDMFQSSNGAKKDVSWLQSQEKIKPQKQMDFDFTSQNQSQMDFGSISRAEFDFGASVMREEPRRVVEAPVVSFDEQIKQNMKLRGMEEEKKVASSKSRNESVHAASKNMDMPKKHSPMKEISSNQYGNAPFGMIKKKNTMEMPQVKSSSPQSDVSSENEDDGAQFEDTSNEKMDFRAPSEYQQDNGRATPRSLAVNNSSIFSTYQQRASLPMNDPFNWGKPQPAKESAAFAFDMSGPPPTPGMMMQQRAEPKQEQEGPSEREKALMKELERMQEQIHELKTRCKDQKSQMDAIKSQQTHDEIRKQKELKEVRLKVEDRDKRILDLEEQVKGLQQFEYKFENEQLDKMEIRNELMAVIEKNEKLKTNVDKVNTQISKKDREIEKLQQDLERYRKNEKTFNEMLEERDYKIEVLNKEIHDLNHKLSQALHKEEKTFVVMKQSQIQKDMERKIQSLNHEFASEDRRNPVEQKQESLLDTEDLEEMMDKPPSGDSDHESDQNQNWEAVKTIYNEMETPAPNETGKVDMIKSRSEKYPLDPRMGTYQKQNSEKSPIQSNDEWNFPTPNEEKKVIEIQEEEPSTFELSWGDQKNQNQSVQKPEEQPKIEQKPVDIQTIDFQFPTQIPSQQPTTNSSGQTQNNFNDIFSMFGAAPQPQPNSQFNTQPTQSNTDPSFSFFGGFNTAKQNEESKQNSQQPIVPTLDLNFVAGENSGKEPISLNSAEVSQPEQHVEGEQKEENSNFMDLDILLQSNQQQEKQKIEIKENSPQQQNRDEEPSPLLRLSPSPVKETGIEEQKQATPTKNQINVDYYELEDNVQSNEPASSNTNQDKQIEERKEENMEKLSMNVEVQEHETTQVQKQEEVVQQSNMSNNQAPSQTLPHLEAPIISSPMPQPLSHAQSQPYLERHSTAPTNSFAPQVQPSSLSRNNTLPMSNSQQQDVSYNLAQFNTLNTMQLQQQQQEQITRLDSQQQFQQVLVNFFRKSLANQRAKLFEDDSIQIGSITSFSGNEVAVKLFFGNRCPQGLPLEKIQFKKMMPPIGFEDFQQIEEIEEVRKGAQKVIDIKIRALDFAISIPVYGMNYTVMGQQKQTVPVRLPITLLKFCQGVNEFDPNQFRMKWESFGHATEARQQFNLDFGQCRSLSALKDVLKLGANVFNFVDGVETQKNIVCATTQCIFQLQCTAYIKIMITANGQKCEIIGRSSDLSKDEPGKFAKFVIMNVLELIALTVI